MSKLTLTLLMTAFAMSVPRPSGATNYHEYKKFNVSGRTERVPSSRHGDLIEHRNHPFYRDRLEPLLRN
jgi:hypothetical protein